jgi:hypothetical protein
VSGRGWWYAAGAALVVAVAWVLTSPGGQARLSAQLGVAAGAGDGPGVQWSGGTPGPGGWVPHTPARAGSRLAGRHPAAASPNLTMLQSTGYDWLFYPPSEGGQ